MSNNQIKYPLYLKAFIKALEEYKQNEKDKPLIKKIVFYGVNIVNMLPEPNKATYFNEAINNFQFSTAITDFIGQLTPREFRSRQAYWR